MKKIILFLIVICLPLCAEEIWLGMVAGVDGDSLILVDGEKVYVKNLLFNRYINEVDQPLDATRVTFPFSASLVINEQMPEHMRANTVRVKIHTFYDLKRGRLIEKASF